MCHCYDHAELIIVHGDLKVYRCIECEREWEEIRPNKSLDGDRE